MTIAEPTPNRMRGADFETPVAETVPQVRYKRVETASHQRSTGPGGLHQALGQHLTMINFSSPTIRSLVFAFGVSLGLAVSALQGVATLDILKTALIASVLFLGFMLGEAGMGRVQKRAMDKRRKKAPEER